MFGVRVARVLFFAENCMIRKGRSNDLDDCPLRRNIRIGDQICQPLAANRKAIMKVAGKQFTTRASRTHCDIKSRLHFQSCSIVCVESILLDRTSECVSIVTHSLARRACRVGHFPFTARLSRCRASSGLPVSAIECAVVDGFRQMFCLDRVASVEIGNRSSDSQNLVMGASRQTHVFHRVLE